MRAEPEVLLGFDYGVKRIGVAVGQSITGSAQPLKTARARHDKPDWATITDLIRTWQPTCLVVGLPLNMDGTEQDTTVKARRFGRQLAARAPCGRTAEHGGGGIQAAVAGTAR